MSNESKKEASEPISGKIAKLPQAGELSAIDAWWGLVAVVFALILLLVIFRPDPYGRILTFVQDGIVVTIFITITTFALTMILGLICGLGRVSKNRVIYGVTSVYVEIIRGIPLLVQLLVWYFAVPALIVQVGNAIHFRPFQQYLANPIVMAIVGISICYAAYMAEIVRAGIEALPTGQMEAARSLGMTKSQSMRYVILPQAYRSIMPTIGNEFIALLKDSSLISVVSVADLTRRGREFLSFSSRPIETYLMMALLYLLMTLISARIARIVENKTKLEK
ncbi:amino acid ABC transporter permease [Anaerolineaceae bacterium oral taxon 439]|nr:amino acid ABC transporter permease [Anaerolineaceae bacterium oral taxon 439]